MSQETESPQPESKPLHLPSLQVQGFRLLKDLKVPRLGRVNLVVGKNNVGKTTLLEAVWLYASGSQAPWVIADILESRREILRDVPAHGRSVSVALPRLFFQGSLEAEGPLLLSIGPLGSEEARLEVELGWKHVTEAGAPQSRQLLLSVTQGRRREEYLISRLGETLALAQWARPRSRILCQRLPAQGFDNKTLAQMWDAVQLTDWEQDIQRAMQLVVPGIERVSMVADQRREPQERIAMARLKGRPRPEPLESLGDGPNRVFEMMLGLVNANDGLFLIDEFENGIHYSIQEELWRLIFEAASQLDIQVFATTHSWDCIEAFQAAASAHMEEGVLVRLDRRQDEVEAVVFDEHKLEILARQSIEVR